MPTLEIIARKIEIVSGDTLSATLQEIESIKPLPGYNANSKSDERAGRDKAAECAAGLDHGWVKRGIRVWAMADAPKHLKAAFKSEDANMYDWLAAIPPDYRDKPARWLPAGSLFTVYNGWSVWIWSEGRRNETF